MNGRPAPWTTPSSETIVEDRWIHVRADTCEDVSGRRIAPFYVLEYGDWISVLALDENDDAILVEEYRHGAGIVAMGTIGGGVEPGESPRDAAARELLEETGFVSEALIELGATWANFGNHTNRVHHFLARRCRRIGEQTLDDSEAIAVHVLSLEGLGDHLSQSYHQLTWYKAMDWLRR
ncbi:NUDIX hydrolase [Microbacterium oxydans]|uniref:NUDIX hydrolase n=1 Tax=Microbacterium oxydans TaxID=82380 RepID=UPI0022B104C1|nr:NUDIX hydrolase [Microbacterium oxydans]MCZ4302675.1 NUDIX hydrolase [Microbacterium oxydans]